MEDAARELRFATRDVVGGKFNVGHMRKAAEHVVAIRETFLNSKGQPDMTGTSYAYRTAIREVLTDAGVPESDRHGVLNAIRYHVSNVLHENYSPEQLQEWGVGPISTRERQKSDRQTRARAMRVLSSVEERLTDPDEIAAALRSVSMWLENIEPSAMSATNRKLTDAFLDSIVSTATSLRSVRKQ